MRIVLRVNIKNVYRTTFFVRRSSVRARDRNDRHCVPIIFHNEDLRNDIISLIAIKKYSDKYESF